MPESLNPGRLTAPDNSLVIPRPRPAKVTTVDKRRTGSLSDVVSEATKQAYGKQGAAAAQLGKDEGNFARDLRAARLTLRDLSDLGAPFLAALGKELLQQYGELHDPKDHARRLIHEMEQHLLELRQFVENAA